jgi:hypothetical protein
VLAPEETALIIKDRLAGVNLFAAAFSFDHRIYETLKLVARPAIEAKSIQWVRMYPVRDRCAIIT